MWIVQLPLARGRLERRQVVLQRLRAHAQWGKATVQVARKMGRSHGSWSVGGKQFEYAVTMRAISVYYTSI